MLTLLRINIIICTFALMLAICSRCADESFDPNTRITFHLRSSQAMAGKITIDKAYLKLSRIEANGALQSERVTNIVHSISSEDPPFQLNDSSSRELYLRLPPAMYDQLAFKLVLFVDDYRLVISEPPASTQTDPAKGNDPTSEGEAGDQPAGNAGNDEGSPQTNDGEDDATNAGNENHDNSGNDGDDEYKGKKDKKDKDKGNKDHGHGNHRISDSETGGRVDLDDFFQNAKPGMVVTGKYENNGKTIRLIFVGSDIEILSVPARQGDSPTVIIGNESVAEITLDPERWFAALTPANIESGTTQTYRGEPVLFIHPDYNSALYEAMIPHIQESADVNFQGDSF